MINTRRAIKDPYIQIKKMTYNRRAIKKTLTPIELKIHKYINIKL